MLPEIEKLKKKEEINWITNYLNNEVLILRLKFMRGDKNILVSPIVSPNQNKKASIKLIIN
jgi:hypothetical protein